MIDNAYTVGPRLRRIALAPLTPFAPLRLAADDCVPVNMALVLAYPYRIEPAALASALAAGLAAFPHLAGVVRGSEPHVDLAIIPSGGEICLEVVEVAPSLATAELELMSDAEQIARFMPAAEAATPLFQSRLTLHAQMSVLGLRVSHMAVDGMGLALILYACSSAMLGLAPSPVFHHDRQCLIPAGIEPPGELPAGYVDAANLAGERRMEWDIAGRCDLGVFSAHVDAIADFFQVTTLRDARFALAALLCRELAELDPRLREIALWCDPRGTSGIPKTYTGNAGVYLHLPLTSDAREIADELRSIPTRAGFARIAAAYRALKNAEQAGRPALWNCLDADVLPVNLPPHAPACLDFGGGLPTFARMLTRNSHGLRLWTSPDGNRFRIEICLPDPLPADLIARCHALGLITATRDVG